MNISKDKALDLLKEWVEQRNENYSNKCDFILNGSYADVYAMEEKNKYNEADEVVGTERVYCKDICFHKDLCNFCDALGVSTLVTVNTCFYSGDIKAGFPFIRLWF